ncbi:MAG: SPOR domain-containing protein [Alphaproteobacteria bacterium]|nr:SPOR domain-containing protein [Alphaproteobacteria bacterium]
MDEFDKIREISEDLTHRREPVFTQLSQKPIPSSVQAGSVQTTPYLSSNQAGVRIDNEQSVSSASSLGVDRQRFLSENVEKPSELNPSFESKGSGLTTPLGNAFSAGLDEEENPSFSFGQTPFSAPFHPEPLVSNDMVEEKHFPSMKLHLIGLTVLVGILGVATAGFFLFNGDSDDITEVVTITAEPTIVKELPDQAGGINIPDQDKLVYNRIRSNNVTTKVESLFPEPEKPVMPQILTIEEEPEETFVQMNEVKAVNPLDEVNVQKTANPVVESVTEPILVKEVIEKPKLPVVAPVKAELKPVSEPETLMLAKASDVKKSIEKEVKTTNQQSKTPVIKGEWKVQLFSSNNKSAVETAWKRILFKHKALLSDMSYKIESAKITGKGTFYRLKVGQFASRDMAAALCDKLKAQKQDCVPAK